MKTKLTLLTAGLLVSLFSELTRAGTLAPATAPAPEYTVIDLGTLGGSYSYAHGISDNGQVVGKSAVGGGFVHAFLYSNGSMQDLGTLGGDDSYAYGINNIGQVVGWLRTVGYDVRAFLYSNGSMRNLGTLGGEFSVAFGINNSGQVVGHSDSVLDSGGKTHAFLYSNGAMQDIGTLGGESSIAYGINDYGQVVGASHSRDRLDSHAFLYSNGSMRNLGTLGGEFSVAFGINNSGQVVGGSSTSTFGFEQAFLYSNGAMRNLGVLGTYSGTAYGINNRGQVVGWWQLIGDGYARAFLYSDGSMRDLNDLIDPASRWQTMVAHAINNAGQIVGDGINSSGQYHAFLLNPLTVEPWRKTIETMPSKPTYGEPPQREDGKDSLIVVTHGWHSTILNPPPFFPPDLSWVDDMSNNIRGYLKNKRVTNWQVHGFKWLRNSWTFFPTDALNNAKQEGWNLGSAIAVQGWSHVHLIGHSAGAEVIQEASEWIKVISPNTTVHCTFLDAYVGKHYEGVRTYGEGSDWSDSYFSRDAITTFGSILTGPFTESPLDHTYNVDVTLLDPNKVIGAKFRSSVTGEMEPCIKTYTSHDWPIDFYANTIPGNPNSDYMGFGFQLSKEGGNWKYATNNYAPGNGTVGNPTPTQVLGHPDPTCLTEIKLTPPVWPNWLTDFATWPTAQSTSGSVKKGNGWITLNSGSPVWLATVVNPTNPVNTVSFDAMFIGTNGSDSRLSVYWETNVIGAVDERYVQPGFQHYSLSFPQATTNSTHVFGLRLDPFTNAPSSIILTNVVLTQVGVSQPFSLSIVTNASNGLLVYELAGEPGFEYSVQASTNLVDWKTIAFLVNTNGKVRFFDEASTNYSRRFYRAVAPY